MKSTTAFSKDLDTKFEKVNYSTDICIIAIEQNNFGTPCFGKYSHNGNEEWIQCPAFMTGVVFLQ